MGFTKIEAYRPNEEKIPSTNKIFITLACGFASKTTTLGNLKTLIGSQVFGIDIFQSKNKNSPKNISEKYWPKSSINSDFEMLFPNLTEVAENFRLRNTCSDMQPTDPKNRS